MSRVPKRALILMCNTFQTIELSRLQVGDDGPADFITSTLIEAENLLPLMLEYQRAGRACSVNSPLTIVCNILVLFFFAFSSFFAAYSL